MLPVANEKQQGVSFNIRLQHVSVIIHFHRKLIKLKHTIVLYMLVNVTCNHSWRTLSWRRSNNQREIIKKFHRQEAFDFRFCPAYIIVTSGPSVLEWAWQRAKCCRVLWKVVIWFRERNSSSTFRTWTRFILFKYFCFNGDEWAAQRKTSCRCNFLIIFFDAFRLQLRVLQEWLQVTLTSIYSTIVCFSLINFRWKWIITETCCKRILKETPCCFSFATGSMMIKYRAR